ncbi:MAG: hypothetical protein Q9183_000596 [Haloplaca sp. 2 TL-2023]
MSAPQISVYSLSDLKNTTDDALPNYLTSLKFKQSHFLTDVRLALGYSAVVIAGVTFYADHKLGWDATKYWTFWAVLAYFTLNGALTYWVWGVEKGKVFEGQLNGATISMASSVKKHTPIYNLKVCCEKAGQQPQTVNISAPFTRWFDSDGYFVATPFQQWLASEVPMVGKADPKKASSVLTSKEPKKVTESQEQMETGPSVVASANGPSTSSTRSRKSKRMP